jgi:hypothetical protein
MRREREEQRRHRRDKKEGKQGNWFAHGDLDVPSRKSDTQPWQDRGELDGTQ